MRPFVTFKDEDDVDGVPIGPVVVYDMDAEAVLTDRLGRPYVTVPFGAPPPEGVTELGWKSRPEAVRIAREHGVELEEA